MSPVPNVTMNLTGDMVTSTMTNGSGFYSFSVPPGGNYIVTPSKAPLAPSSPGIDTVDAIAVQAHFLNIAFLPPGCPQTAADVNADTMIDTVDVVAIQRFFLGHSTGIANTGKFKFMPPSRTYTGVTTDQMNQNYDTLVFGDVTSNFVYRPEGPSEQEAAEVPITVETLALPNAAVAPSTTDFIAAVTTTNIDAKNKLVGFQGDFTFDERRVTFQSEPVQNAGLTADNWNVSANILPAAKPGPIRTLRISAFSLDLTPLSGSGTLFELRMTRVSKPAPATQLIWAQPPDNFIFIDSDLKMQKPGNAAPGSVAPSAKRK